MVAMISAKAHNPSMAELDVGQSQRAFTLV
jgi:hypothetical protein